MATRSIATLALAASLLAGGAAHAQVIAGCDGAGEGGGTLARLAEGVTGALENIAVARPAPAAPRPKIPVEVSLVLTDREIDRYVDLLWDFSKTPEGARLFDELMDSADRPDTEQQARWKRLMDAFRAADKLRDATLLAFPELDVLEPVRVRLYYNEPALQRKIKEKVDEYFLTHTFTRWGEIFPRSGARIRRRQVNRPNSIFNRLSWQMIRGMEPELIRSANGEIGSFLDRAGAEGSVEIVPTQGNAHGETTGYLVLKAGERSTTVRLPENGLVDRSVLLDRMRDAATRLSR